MTFLYKYWELFESIIRLKVIATQEAKNKLKIKNRSFKMKKLFILIAALTVFSVVSVYAESSNGRDEHDRLRFDIRQHRILEQQKNNSIN